MGKIIGIDLGTTNSVVSIMEGETPTVIINEEGARTTPSVVSFTKDGERLVGATARRQAIINPTTTIYSIKRFMGQRWEEAQKESARVPYKIVRAGDQPKVDINGKEFSAPEISAMILQKLKREAEKYLGQSVTEAVITVPAYFNDAQRQATKDAGKIAGLEVKRIINEPTAAALAYGFGKKRKDQVIVVYDFGGGTFDVSVLDVGDNVVEVRSTNGDTHLGGDDIDNMLIDWLTREFKNETGLDVSKEKTVLQRLKEAAEKAKIELSSSQNATISLPFLFGDATGPKHLERTLNRARFEQMIEPIIERTIEPCRLALKDAKLSPGQIDEVLLVGGSTRIPLVQEKVKRFFGREPNRTVNPDEVVAIGAAVQGGVLAGDVTDMLLLDVTPLSLGIETLGGVMTTLIQRNTTIPTKKAETFSTAADGQTAVDVNVYQGERPLAKDNRLLGTFRLDGIPAAPRGTPQIEVTFDLDANGILNVHAKDKSTGREQKITITSSSGLSKEDVDKLVREASANEAEDKRRREIIEERNKLDNLIYQTDKQLRDNKEKMSPDQISGIEASIQSAKQALDSDNAQTMKAAHDQLMQVLMKAGEAMHGGAGGGPGGPGAGGPGDGGKSGGGRGGKGDVIDADFEDA